MSSETTPTFAQFRAYMQEMEGFALNRVDEGEMGVVRADEDGLTLFTAKEGMHDVYYDAIAPWFDRLLVQRYLSTTLAWTGLLLLAVYLLLACAGRARGHGTPLDAHFARSLYEAALWGTLAYSALFASLSAIVKHPMIVGIAYAFAVEGFLANLPGKNQTLSLQY